MNESLKNEFIQFTNTMSGTINAWEGFINKNASKYPQVKSFQTQVPYNRSANAEATLSQIFGDTPNARTAAQILLRMIILVNQTLLSLRQIEGLNQRLSPEVVSEQVKRAQNFIYNLQAFVG